ncbi:MAG: glycosyltransferase [Deltaproteobacteria bacterium]|nr:glycosyltransferase [Deltaproteobacteria bacterium]
MDKPLTGQAPASAATRVHTISVVVPVYQGEQTLAGLVDEIAPLVAVQTTPAGRHYRVSEVVMVHDGAVDGSHRVMQKLAAEHAFVRPLWLSRNYGQHPATLAGMASSSGDWVVTVDEDGQQNPTDIGKLLDVALNGGHSLVYAKPLNPPPHGFFRNAMSGLAKWFFVTLLSNVSIGRFNSFRLIHGEIARSVSAYCGNQVYLDVALGWVVPGSGHCPVMLRDEGSRRSGYNLRKLVAHFWRLVLTSGTRPLRLISLLGTLSVLAAFAISAFAVWEKIMSRVPVAGWTSLMIVLCFFSGLILFSLGVACEYLGITLNMAMGKPLYMLVSRPLNSDEDRV